MPVKTKIRPRPAVADAPASDRGKLLTYKQAAEHASRRLNQNVTVGALRFWKGLEVRQILNKNRLTLGNLDDHIDKMIAEAPRRFLTDTRGRS